MNSSVQRKKKKASQHKIVFKMICDSNPKEIVCIERFLRRVSTKIHIDDGTMYRLLVSCTEAVNNAIIHGNKSNPAKKVVIRCIAGKQELTISVKDEGKGFDPESLQDPRTEENLLKEDGRGVFLIRSLMDKVKFKRLKSGSLVEMKIKLH